MTPAQHDEGAAIKKAKRKKIALCCFSPPFSAPLDRQKCELPSQMRMENETPNDAALSGSHATSKFSGGHSSFILASRILRG
jgi:hypothetical protein